jgi:hypothetical protein
MSIPTSVKTVNALTIKVKINTAIQCQITSLQAQKIREVCLHKISHPPKTQKILLASVENEFNITKRLYMRYENTDHIHEKLQNITILNFPVKYEKQEKQIGYEDVECDDIEHQYSYGIMEHQCSYGIMDNLDYVFIEKSNNINGMDMDGRTFSRGYVSLTNHIFPIFQTPYVSHVYPLGITPIYYWVLKYLDNKLLNPRSNADYESIKTIMGKYTDVDVNMTITLDGYRNNSCRYWNETTNQYQYYFTLSKKDQRFIDPNYESDEDEYYEEYYGDSDSD